MDTPYFADVLLPLPLDMCFTYGIPEEFRSGIAVGQRVVVQFGARKIYTALVRRLHQNAPPGIQPKEIITVLDSTPLVGEVQFAFWEWVAAYYMCSPGEVMDAALPAALKLSSETSIKLHPSFTGDFSHLSEKEEMLVEALQHQESITLTDISRALEMKKVIPVVKSLLEKELVILLEELEDRYKPRMDSYVSLHRDYAENEDRFREVFDVMEKKAPRQLEMLMNFIHLSHGGSSGFKEVGKKELLKQPGATLHTLNELVKKGILLVEERKHDLFGEVTFLADPVELNEMQSTAYEKINDAFTTNEVVLLHGVTSSGKTEIYIRLINEAIQQGKQVLYLLPEIALTTQIITRLRKVFGNKVGVYHSRFSENQRVEVWEAVRSQGIEEKFMIILGARSATFLPFENLGLVIVDEEHDSSFKQYEPAPRYHARDAAIYLAKQSGAKTLLGSATPSLESYFNAQTGRYGLVEMDQRFGGMEMPEIIVVDVKKESFARRMTSHFSNILIDHIREALGNGEQVILFQNRRGFALRLECDICQWMPGCKNCDVTLIYHKQSNQLRCHYCGYTEEVPQHCPECKSNHISMKGFGTEKVEEELGMIFPDAVIKRMDLDTTRSKNAYQQIISGFEDRKIDILVGTQMVTKGLDFDNVSVVCVLNADNMLSFPDFRASERSYQLMAQVSGRAGRKNKRGKVIIQTWQPANRVIRYVVANDYTSLYHYLLNERSKFHYPPVYRLITIRLKHRKSDTLNKAAREFARDLKEVFGKRVLGPEYPMVSRIRNLYIKQVMIKLERESNLATRKMEISAIIRRFLSLPENKQVRIHVDVDTI